jgi:hypothetical protein
MTTQFNLPSSKNYQSLVEQLFALDCIQKSKVDLGYVIPHFLQIHSLLRSCIEYCEVAFREANFGHVLPARALLRSSFDQAILASYLYKHPNGPEATLLILEKNNRELAEKAISAGAINSGEKFLETLKSTSSENEAISTRTGNPIKSFNEKKLLHDFYFLLGQAVHPKAAFSQYIDLDVATVKRQIRRTSLDQDASSVHPFTFQILVIAMLLDADTRSDQELRNRMIEISKGHCFWPELSV